VKGPLCYTARKLRLLKQAACSCVFLAVLLAVPAWAEPTIEGTLETGGYVYTPRPYDFAGTGATQYRIYENVSFDATFNSNWSFHFNSRFGYQSQNREAPNGVILNFYYGYVEYDSDRFDFQFGRIMDFTNLVYLYFDGARVQGKGKVGNNKLTLDVYGGMIVRDDYLEEYGNPYVLRTFNSTDYRSLFISQRLGDYVAGASFTLQAPKAAIFGADYQIVFNRNALAEHYASLNLETVFSKKFKLYGYGTLDLVALLPSNTLAAIQIDPVDAFSLILSHEYYRPVFLRNSYFWTYFKPYGNQDVSATFIFPISKPLTLDLKYGAIFYDSTTEVGQELAASIENRNINRFGVKAEANFITGPEGNLVTLQLMLRRRIVMVGLVAGGGIEFYNDKKLTDGYSRGYFATLGADIEIVKQVILALNGECSGNQQTRYDIRGTFSLKYSF
jgi:hypothetical protein